MANVAAELALLGELVYDNSNIDRVADALRPDEFADRLYGRIYSLIIREAAARRHVNLITIAPFFSSDDEFAERKCVKLIDDATAQAVAGTQPLSYAHNISVLARRRRLAAGLREAIFIAGDLEKSHDEIAGAADSALTAFVEGRQDLRQYSAEDCVDEVIAGWDRPRAGVKCGIIGTLDDLIGARRPGDMIILAGRPGMGKTATAISYMWGAANMGHPGLFVSAEMNWGSLGERLVADYCTTTKRAVPYDAILKGNPSPEQRKIILEARQHIARLPLRIVDKACHTVPQIRRAIRRRKRELEAQGKKLELVIVDYMQLLSPDIPSKSETEDVTKVSKALKMTATEEEVVMIVLSQLNRQVESRPDKRPQLSDLRQSGQIEQDADAVVFLLSQEYYLGKSMPDAADAAKYDEWQAKMDRYRDRLEFIVAKHRNGPEGNATGYFFRTSQAVRGADFFELGGPN